MLARRSGGLESCHWGRLLAVRLDAKPENLGDFASYWNSYQYTDVFYPKVPIEDREQRVIRYGSSNEAKGKNWQSIIKRCSPILEEEGFICNFTPIDEITAKAGVLPVSGFVDRYNKASYVLCASVSEGTPNNISESDGVVTREQLAKDYNECSYVLCASASEASPNSSNEAAACGCVVVSTNVGNIREWGDNRSNCVIADRNSHSFIEMLKWSRTNRERISINITEKMKSWSYSGEDGRAQYFYQLWRRLIDDGPDSIQPFSYDSISWKDI